MNRTGRPALALLPVTLLCWFAGTPAALGQTLTNAQKTAPDVTPHRAAIQAYVDAAARRLASEDIAEQSKARDLLAGGVTLTGGGAGAEPSAAFLDAYSLAAAKALQPLTAHADMRVRLNAAIAAARIAEKANNLRLADVAIRFMNDKAPAVSLWGVKAAREMVPAAVAGPANNPLMPALIKVVQSNPLSAIVSEIYQALTLDIFSAAVNAGPQPAQIKAVVPHMLGVYRQRANAYARGALPADPSVDNLAAEFLTFTPVWSQLTPQQRTQTVQTISDVLGFAGQYAELMAGDERQPLIPLFTRTGKSLQVVGDSMNLPGVSKAARDVQAITTGMDGTDVRNRADAVASALKATQPFSTVKPAAPISMGGEPEPSAGSPDTAATPGGDAGTGPAAGFNGKSGQGGASGAGPAGAGPANRSGKAPPPPPPSRPVPPAGRQPAPPPGNRPAPPGGTAPPPSGTSPAQPNRPAPPPGQ